MSTVKAKRWVLKNAFVGYPKRDDFEIVEETLPPLKDGGKPLHASTIACIRRTTNQLAHFFRDRISSRGLMDNSGSLHEVPVCAFRLL